MFLIDQQPFVSNVFHTSQNADPIVLVSEKMAFIQQMVSRVHCLR